MVLQISLMVTMARVEVQVVVLLQGPLLVLVKQAGQAALVWQTLVVVKREKPLLAVVAMAPQGLLVAVQQDLLLLEQPCVKAMEGPSASFVQAVV